MTVDDMEYVILGLVGLVHYELRDVQDCVRVARANASQWQDAFLQTERRSELRDLPNEGDDESKSELVARRSQ